MAEKARYWVGILYPENMIENWEDEIGEKLQLPYAYCIHDKCTEKDGKTPRKVHVHLMVVFPNTTTYKHALSVFKTLDKPGIKETACNTVERILGVRHMYDYLIHDTEDCRKKGKHLYEQNERICGNNFDIGSYEQLSATEKLDMLDELCDDIIDQNFRNFRQFFLYVRENRDKEYREIIKANSGLLDRLIKGNYQDYITQEQDNYFNAE